LSSIIGGRAGLKVSFRFKGVVSGKEILMIGTPEIIETRPRAAAVIHVTVSRDEIRTVMPVAIREILATLSSQGIAPVGPLFDHHLKTSEQAFDFEVGFPIVSPIQPTGRVKNGEHSSRHRSSHRGMMT
jgi:hypothetical protein